MKSAQTVTDGDNKLVIPPGLAKLGATRGFDPPEPHRLRFYLTGKPGCGKTTFVSSIDGALIIDPEDSSCMVPNPKAMRFTPHTGKELMDMVHELIRMKAGPSNPVKHIVFDTIEKAQTLIIPWLTDHHNETHPRSTPLLDIREYGTKGAGWGKINDMTLGIMHKLYLAGYGWTCCGHLQESTIEDPISKKPITKLEPLINPGIRGGLYRDAQYMAYLREAVVSSRVEKKVGTRTVKTSQKRPQYLLELTSPEGTSTMTTQIVKERLGSYMPDVLDVTGSDGWNIFSGAYDGAREKAVCSPK